MSYGMPTRSSTRPRDPNQLAKLIVDIAIGETRDETEMKPKKNPAAVALGRLGGSKGGRARANRLTPDERHEIAAKAARARWSKNSNPK
jgi:hypothetical protein